MRLPQLSTAGLMSLILIAAFNCVGIGMMVNGLELPTNEINCTRPGSSRSDYLQRQVAFAVVPTANILAFVGVWGRRRQGRIGFLVAGSLAMVAVGLHAAWLAASPYNEYRLRGYKSWGDYLLCEWAASPVTSIRQVVVMMPQPLRPPCGFMFVVFLVSGLPTAAQLGIGSLGWWFDRRYEIRRRPPPPGEGTGPDWIDRSSRLSTGRR